MAGLIGIRASAADWSAFLAGPRPGPRLSTLLSFWGRRGRIIGSLGWSLAVAIGLAWPIGIYWAAYHWSSGWRLLYEFLSGGVLYLWLGMVLHVLGVPPLRREVYGAAALPLRSRSFGATASSSGWASDAIWTRVDPVGFQQPADFGSGFAGPLDARLRLFAADCAEHLLAVAHAAGDRRGGRTARVVRRARARANARVPRWKLPILIARARDTRPLQARIDRRSDEGDDAACAAFHALVAPTPLNAAQAALNCCSVNARRELRDKEYAWELERLDWYRGGGQAGD
jgi:hypothetical protein